MTPSPTPSANHVREVTDEVLRPTVRAVGPVACDLLPERIDALTRVLAARDSAMLSELGHMRCDLKDLTASVRELTVALQPIVQDRVDQRAEEKVRSELHQRQETVSKAWADLFSSPTTKAVIAAIVGAIASAGLLRSCVLVEPPPEPVEAHADGAFWRGR